MFLKKKEKAKRKENLRQSRSRRNSTRKSKQRRAWKIYNELKLQSLPTSMLYVCNLLRSIAGFPEGDPAILKGQGGERSMEFSTRDIIEMRDK